MVRRFLPAAVAVLGYILLIAGFALIDYRLALIAAGLAAIYEAREAER